MLKDVDILYVRNQLFLFQDSMIWPELYAVSLVLSWQASFPSWTVMLAFCLLFGLFILRYALHQREFLPGCFEWPVCRKEHSLKNRQQSRNHARHCIFPFIKQHLPQQTHFFPLVERKKKTRRQRWDSGRSSAGPTKERNLKKKEGIWSYLCRRNMWWTPAFL